MKRRHDEPVHITLILKVHHMIISMKNGGMENKPRHLLGSLVLIGAFMKGGSLVSSVLAVSVTKCMRTVLQMRDQIPELQTMLCLALVIYIGLIPSHQVLKETWESAVLLIKLQGTSKMNEYHVKLGEHSRSQAPWQMPTKFTTHRSWFSHLLFFNNDMLVSLLRSLGL